jgi:hypothetical protein
MHVSALIIVTGIFFVVQAQFLCIVIMMTLSEKNQKRKKKPKKNKNKRKMTVYLKRMLSD